MKIRSFQVISLAVMFSMVLSPFAASVSAASGQTPPVPEGRSAGVLPTWAQPPVDTVTAQPEPFHKVIARKGVLDASREGITLWHDYGAFALYKVTETALNQLTLAARSEINLATDADIIQLEAYTFDTQTDAFDAIPESMRVVQPSGSALHLIQFVGPIKDAWLQAVQETGATPIHYIANYGYLVWADDAARARLHDLASVKDFVQFSAPYQTYFKLGATIRDRLESAYDVNEMVKVTIQMYDHAGKTGTENLIASLTQERLSAWTPILNYQNIIITVRAGDIATIAVQPDVVWVGERLERTLMDEVQDQILAGHFDGSMTGPSSPGYLNWLTQTVGISTDPTDYPIVDVTDDGIGNGTTASGDSTFHEFGNLANPTRLAYVANCTDSADGGGPDGHGHINTSIVGSYDTRSGFPYQDPGGYLRGLGVSPFGRMAGTRIFDPGFDQSSCGGTDTGVIKSVQDNGAQINTNSWGCGGCAGSYDDSSQAYDVGVRDADLTEAGNQELIIFFSSGNDGPGAGTVGTPGNGKNMITVGASENDRPSDEDGPWTDGCGIGPTGADNAMDVIGFSSRGPAPSDRVKPELIAPGTHIQGTASTHPSYNGSGVCDQYRPSGQTTFAASSGTSHSTPAVAGVGSLYYYWLQTRYGVTPSPALMKAYLIAHPTYLTGVSANDTLPSNNQGYGMPNLELGFDNTFRYLLNQTELFDNTGEDWTYNAQVADPSKPVRIVMAYTDQAGAIGVSPEVNNLDLEVVVGGNTYVGNNFSGAWSVTGGSADADNNYEAVFLPAGASGKIDVTVTAFNIAGDGVPNTGDATDQDFALVCYNCVLGNVGWLDGIVYDAAGAPATDPLVGAGVQAQGLAPTHTGGTTAGAAGYYRMGLLTDTYTVTASAYGYYPNEISGVSVISGTTTTLDIPLTSAPWHVVEGVVTDVTTGWPLYASIQVAGYPYGTIWSDPVSGYYSLTLPAGMTHTFQVNAWVAGYDPAGRDVGPLTGNQTEDFALNADMAACTAPGYTGAPCGPQAGGLVVGNTYDDNTGDPVEGVDVANDSGESTVTAATPGDPAVDDSFYTLFSPAGSHTFTATMTAYSNEALAVTVVQSNTVRQDFYLKSSFPVFDPTSLWATVNMGVSTTLPLTLSNLGDGVLDYEFQEQDGGFQPLLSVVEASSFSASAPIGPLSVRSDEGRVALAPDGPNAPLAWAGAAPIPAGAGVVRYAHTQCPGEDSFYVISGVDEGFSPTANAWRYDADTDTWNALTPFPAPQEGSVAVCYEGYIYVLGGGGTNQFYIYDIAGDAWVAAPTPLPRNMWGAAVGVWDGKIYMIGGDDDFSFGGTSGAVDIYDIAGGTWSSGAPMPNAAVTAGDVQAGPYVYVVGGWGDASPGANVNATQRYDMSADVWETGPTFTSARGDLALAITEQSLYAIGGDADGGGAFDASTLVETLDYTTWPGGAWNDISDPLPTGLTAVGGGFCTEAMADGEVWLTGGGTAGAGSIVGTNQYRLSEGCLTGVGDVPWLSESPITGTLPALNSQVVDVTFDASVPEASQPGDYYAALRLHNNSPLGPLNVPVTMTVVPLSTTGKLEGAVIGLGHCDVNPTPLEGADVLVEGSSGMSWTLTTDPAGYYQWWLDEAESPLTITVVAPDHTAGLATSVMIAGQTTTTMIFDLRWLRPCVDVAAPSLEATLDMGTSATLPVTITNTGAAPLGFEFFEADRGFTPALLRAFGHGEWLYHAQEGVLLPTNDGGETLAYPSAYRWTPLVESLMAMNVLVYADDFVHTSPNTYLDQALQALGYAYTAHYDGDFAGFETSLTTGGPWDVVLFGNDNNTPPASTLTALNDYVNAGGKLVLHSWRVSNYLGNPLWTTLGFTFVSNVTTGDDVYWWDPGHMMFDGVPEFVGLVAAGGIQGQRVEPLTGFEALAGYTTPGPDPNEAGLILGNDGRTVFRGFLDAGNDLNNDSDAMLDGVELWMNLIEGIQVGFGGDVPWLYEDPITGTLPADTGFIAADVTLDAAYVGLPGAYYATLNLNSDDPVNDRYSYPVTMTVTVPPNYGKLEGAVTGLGYCDADPHPLEGADVLIEGSSGVSWTLTTGPGGYYQWWLDQAESPLTITVVAPEHEVGLATGVMIAGMTTTTVDFNLRWLVPCVDVAAPPLEATLDWGMSATLPVTITNTGAAALDFELKERDGGFVPVLAGGGPDPFGYVYRDSAEPDGPTYDWVEIAPPMGGSGVGAGMSGQDDDHVFPIPMSFPFNFYGTDYTQLAFGSNGTVYFEDTYLGLGNVAIPGSNSYGVNTFIAHYWDDLVVDASGEVYYLDEGDKIIIEYYNTGLYGDSDLGSWEIILFDNGNILFQYLDAALDYGASATIGIQGDQTTGLQYSYDTASLSDSLAICFAYPGEDPSCSAADVPWLSEAPVTGTLAADGGAVVVDVTFDAGLAPQPAMHYYATLSIRNNDPVYGNIGLPVTLTVNAPATWGKLEGAVTGLGYCDADPAPLANADVLVEGSSGMSWTLTTDPAGYYQWWLDEAESPLTLTVTYLDHTMGLATSVMVAGQTTTTMNFDLRWLRPCVDVEPLELSAVVDMGMSTTLPLSLTNTGAVSTNFQLAEEEGGYVPLIAGWLDVGYAPLAAPCEEIYGDTSSPWSGGARDRGNIFEAAEDTSIREIRVYLEFAATTDMYFVVYEGDALVGSYTQIHQSWIADTGAGAGWYSSGPINVPAQAGKFYYVGASWNGSATYYRSSGATPFATTCFGTLHTGVPANLAGYPPAPTMNNTYSSGNFSPYHFAIVTGGGDVPWLSEDPVTGTLDADTGFQLVDVTFDAGVPEVTQPGEYYATLEVGSDDPMSPLGLPVTMTVNAPADWGKLEGTVESLGRCDSDPAPLEGVDVLVETSTGLSWTLTTAPDGYYTWWMTDTESPITVTVAPAEHEPGQATGVIITAQMTTTVDFDLRWLVPCVDAQAPPLEATLDMGMSATLPLSLTNTGAVSTEFALAEEDEGYMPALYLSLPEYAPPIIVSAPSEGNSYSEIGHQAQLMPGEVAIPTAPARYMGPNALVFYGARAAFDADFPDLPLEDFENTLVPPNSVQSCPGPFDSTTNNACFAPGGILDGIRLMNSNPANDMVVLTAPFMGVPSSVVGPDTFADEHDIIFLGEGVHAVGFDLLAPNGAATFDIYIYGLGDVLLGQTSSLGDLPPVFWGVYSDEPITRIRTESATGDGELVDNIAFGGGVPWLFEDPITGTLDADVGFQLVDVTLDAGVPEITQPGEYYATLNVNSADPGGSVGLPVTLTVNAPADWGKLEGTVTSLGYCDADPAPLEGVDVLVESSTGATWTLTTNPDGYYTVWMDEVESPLTVTVAPLEHGPGLATGVMITGAMTTTVDFDLRWLEPCMEATPLSMEATLGLGASEVQTLTLYNWGAGDSDLALFDVEPWLSENPVTGTVSADSMFDVAVTFTALPTMTEGIYTATLIADTDDPVVGSFDLPVTMTVVSTPTCGFESSSPDWLGETTTFTNTTSGAAPLTYRWDLGDNSPISAAVNPTHDYALAGWYTVVLTAENPYGVDVCTGTVEIVTPPPTYTLTVHTVGSGTVTLDPTGGVYYENTVVTLTAVPDGGWYFVGWSGNLTIANNPANLTMDGDKVVTATFSVTPPPTYTLTVGVVGNGSVARSPSQTTYISGTLVRLTAEPDGGWYFVGWSGDLTIANNPADLMMDANKAVTATFSTTPPPTYTLAVAVVGSGSVFRLPNQTAYISGTLVQLAAVSDSGWNFDSWDGDLTGNTNPDSILMDSDKVVTATFVVSCVDVAGADFTAVENPPLVVRFSGAVTAGSPPITYTWNFGDGSVGSGQIVTHTYALSSTLTYSVTMTAANACPSQDTVERSITLHPFTIYLPLVMRNG